MWERTYLGTHVWSFTYLQDLIMYCAPETEIHMYVHVRKTTLSFQYLFLFFTVFESDTIDLN